MSAETYPTDIMQKSYIFFHIEMVYVYVVMYVQARIFSLSFNDSSLLTIKNYMQARDTDTSLRCQIHTNARLYIYIYIYRHIKYKQTTLKL